MKEIKYAVQVVLLNDNKEVLCVSRKDDHWDFGLPGGKVDPEDNGDFEAAAIRETKEETGLDITNLTLIYAKHRDGYMGYTYLADWTGEIETDEPHVVGWDGFEAICEGSFCEWNHEVHESMLSSGMEPRWELTGNLYKHPEDRDLHSHLEPITMEDIHAMLGDIKDIEPYVQNGAKCKICEDYIISARRFGQSVSCKCGAVSVSGGNTEYTKIEGMDTSYDQLLVGKTSTLKEKADKLLWGTRGKYGKQPLTLVLLKNCETEHLEAILDTQGKAASYITDTIGYILKERRKKIK